ncbi:MAG: hypothetical protein KDH88_15820 [Chromatiales bacterium]|nr:hypothetical protein [Chromatiales bacterium]
MRTRLASFPIAICALVLLCSGTAIAKDKDLLSAMVDLERAYIPALFLTGAENEALAPAAMDAYVATWLQFYADYGNYRPSYRNWKSYLDEINFHVEMASELVIEGALLEAHEEHMELIRKIMRDFRGSNGFPKFITDRMTDFHSLMGQIIEIVKGTIGSAEIATLYDLYKDASKAWSKVEKNPVDQELWQLSDEKLMQLKMFIHAERMALDAFEAALATGNADVIRATGLAIKPPQVQAYLLFGNFGS